MLIAVSARQFRTAFKDEDTYVKNYKYGFSIVNVGAATKILMSHTAHNTSKISQEMQDLFGIGVEVYSIQQSAS